MLVSVNNDVTNRTVTNYYGGGGSLKVKKTDSQLGSRYYAYEGINPLCEYDSTGTVKKKYVYAFGKCIAYVDSSGAKFWLHQDALGSVKVVTNINGDTVSTYKYYPFGDSLLTRGSSKNDVQFTGKQNIAGIEAYDFSARYYDPEIGRFYSIDPMGSAATSPYAYCSNDPVNRVDPTGMVDQSAGYPKGWTDFRYNRWEAWDMYSNRDRTAPDGDDLTSSGPNYGLWLGSSQSFTQHLRRIGSAEYARYAENENNSEKMFYYAKKDYFRTYDLDKVTVTEKYWNVCRQGEGEMTKGADYIYAHNDVLRGYLEAEMAELSKVQGYDEIQLASMDGWELLESLDAYHIAYAGAACATGALYSAQAGTLCIQTGLGLMSSGNPYGGAGGAVAIGTGVVCYGVSIGCLYGSKLCYDELNKRRKKR